MKLSLIALFAVSGVMAIVVTVKVMSVDEPRSTEISVNRSMSLLNVASENARLRQPAAGLTATSAGDSDLEAQRERELRDKQEQILRAKYEAAEQELKNQQAEEAAQQAAQQAGQSKAECMRLAQGPNILRSHRIAITELCNANIPLQMLQSCLNRVADQNLLASQRAAIVSECTGSASAVNRIAPPPAPPAAPIVNGVTGEVITPTGGGGYIGTGDGRVYAPAGPNGAIDARTGRFATVQ
jgi:hypothetical protein